MRKKFSQQAQGKRVASRLYPLAGCRVFYLRTDTEYRHQEDHQLKYSRQDRIVQVNGIVQPGVTERMRVDHNRLELSHDLVGRIAFSQSGLQTDRSACQNRHRLHIPEKQGCGDQVGAVGIERQSRLLSRSSFDGKVFRYIENTVYISLLHLPACLIEGSCLVDNFRLFESIQLADQVTGCGRAVHVDHCDRQIGRQPVLHQRQEKDNTESRSDQHTEEIDRLRCQPVHFPLRHIPDTM